MYEEIPRSSAIQLDELKADLPDLIRKTLSLLEGIEAQPTTRQDAEASTDRLLSASRAGIELYNNGALEFMREGQQIGVLDASISQLEGLLEKISRGEPLPSPSELILALSRAQAEANPPALANGEAVRSCIDNLNHRYNRLQSSIQQREREVYASPDEIEVQQARALLSMDFDPISTHFKLSQALIRKGEYSEALKHLRLIYEQEPEVPHHSYFLASCLFDLDLLTEAKAIALRAVEMRFNSQNPLVWELLGNIHESSGEKQEAALAFLRAAALSPAGSSADIALQRLAAVKGLQMPRPEHFRLPETDERFEYVRNGVPGNCRIRIFKEGNARVVVLASQDDLQTGQSITNAAESIAEEVSQSFQIAHDRLFWVEHYQGSTFDSTSLQVVDFVSKEGRLTDPKWYPLTHREFENLTGYRLTWSVARK